MMISAAAVIEVETKVVKVRRSDDVFWWDAFTRKFFLEMCLRVSWSWKELYKMGEAAGYWERHVHDCVAHLEARGLIEQRLDLRWVIS